MYWLSLIAVLLAWSCIVQFLISFWWNSCTCHFHDVVISILIFFCHLLHLCIIWCYFLDAVCCLVAMFFYWIFFIFWFCYRMPVRRDIFGSPLDGESRNTSFVDYTSYLYRKCGSPVALTLSWSVHCSFNHSSIKYSRHTFLKNL